MKKMITLSLFFIVSCSSVEKLPEQTEVNNYAMEGTPSEKIIGDQELTIEKNAEQVKGHMTGPKSQTGTIYNAKSCSFTYEKGMGQMTETSPEFKFETITLNVTGFDSEEDEATFERISYSNVDFVDLYKDWDFSESFGPVNLDNSAKFGNNTKEASLEFIKDEKSAKMIFKHAWVFEGGDSSFFEEGERRQYVAVLDFSKFDQKEILLNNANIKVFNGDEKSGQLVMNVDCIDFK